MDRAVGIWPSVVGEAGSGEGGCIHQRMWEAHFGSVDGAIAGCFHEGEVFGVLGVEYYVVHCILESSDLSVENLSTSVRKVACLKSVHGGRRMLDLGRAAVAEGREEGKSGLRC